MTRARLAVFFILLSASTSWGQQLRAPAHFVLKLGAGYDQGDYGSTATTRTYYAPVSLRFVANRFDVGFTSAFARLDTAGGVRLIDGVPTRTNSRAGPLLESGIGDTVLRSRFFLNDSITPFVKVKIPTADESRGLGTGKTDYGFGSEFYKRMGTVSVFGDLAYTVIGKVPGLDLRNRTAAGAGIGKDVTDAVNVSGMLDWRRAIIVGNPDPVELTGVVSLRMSPSVTFSPNAFVGLTRGSSDVGVGMELNFRFGRW